VSREFYLWILICLLTGVIREERETHTHTTVLVVRLVNDHSGHLVF